MTRGRKSQNGRRVVVFSRELRPAELPGLPDGLKYVHVPSAYEAAAEVLAAPTTALIVDLDDLSPPHLMLLDISRKLGLELLGIGGIPRGMTATDLSGLRLVSMGNLCAWLERLGDSANHSEQPFSGDAAGRGSGFAEGDRDPGHWTRDGESAAEERDPSVVKSDEGEISAETPSIPAPQRRPLLSPEELSALLRDSRDG